MATLSSNRERRSVPVIGLVGIDPLLAEQHFHHSVMTKASGKKEWCLAVIIWLVGVDICPPD